jgi:hypothetical protein
MVVSVMKFLLNVQERNVDHFIYSILRITILENEIIAKTIMNLFIPLMKFDIRAYKSEINLMTLLRENPKIFF